jgi:hypothetical protein
LAALPFGSVNETYDAVYSRGVEPEAHDVFARKSPRDVGIQNVVENLVRRERVLIDLAGA